MITNTIAAQIVVIAKQPVPGQAKTRLSPPYTPEQAAVLAEAALADTLDAVATAAVERRVLALDGAAGSWLPHGFDVISQRGDGLDERLACAIEDAYAGLPRAPLLVGMDTPQVTAALLERAATQLDSADAVLGPAADGGFWLLGARVPPGDLIRGVPMSSGSTGREQHRRLVHAGLRVGRLPALTDVDTAADARLVARQAPDTRFAAVLAASENKQDKQNKQGAA